MTDGRDQIKFDHLGIASVLERRRLRVPLNQRDYSWGETQVNSLLTDLAAAINDDRTHFLGTVVLTRGQGDVAEVTDGQQRLATTTILLAAIRDWFFYNEVNEHANSIESDFLQKFKREESSVVPRLALNVDDNAYFLHRVLSRPGDPKRRSAEPSRESHKYIDQASNIAARHLSALVEPYAKDQQVKILNRWAAFLSEKAQVVVLDVPDDLDAFLMFETLNDRGLRASQADLIKNFLISQAKDRKAEAQQKWAQMTGILESLGQDDTTVTYLHHLLITEHGPMRAVEILGKVKSRVQGPSQSLSFLDEAAEVANDYAALFNSDHSKWNEYGTATRKHISTINRDLRVQQIRPLMLAVARHFPPREAEKAFRLFVYWSVRFLIAGGRGGLLDRNYAVRAKEIGEQRIKTTAQLAEALNDIVPSDALFETSFAEARVSSSFLARYYLRAMERQLQNLPDPEWVPSEEEDAVNLEHILPVNPKGEWSHVSQDTASAYFRRIGNMVIMQARKNSVVGNGSFAEKRAVFETSAFALTQAISKFHDWGPEQIEQRQRELAKLAVRTWPIQ